MIYSIMRYTNTEDIDRITAMMSSMHDEMVKEFGAYAIFDMRFLVNPHIFEILYGNASVIEFFDIPTLGRLRFCDIEVLSDVDISKGVIQLVYNRDAIKPITSSVIFPVFPKIHTNPHIEKVIFNKPATIVFWSDDTKTVVKCEEGDVWDEEKGLAMAVCKKMLGLKEFYKQYNKATSEMWENINI